MKYKLDKKGKFMIHSNYEFDGFATGDDGEEDEATIWFATNLVNHREVIDADSIRVYAHGNNPASHLGYDADADTEMQCPEDMMQQCSAYLKEQDKRVALKAIIA